MTSADLPPCGVAIVDKPPGVTSHDVVAQVRRLLALRRVGHAGTLDPMATGVLVVGVGRATRLLGHLTLTDKTYRARVTLGVGTDTDDAEGRVLNRTDASGLADSEIARVVASLTGTLRQVPPAVSAIKVDGRRAYARARAGEEVQLAAREVRVDRFAWWRTGPPPPGPDAPAAVELECEISCSTGTYVRSLARDLGAGLGVGGHLSALRRTRVGPFTDPRPLADGLVLLPVAEVLRRCFPVRCVDEAEAREISFGRPLPASGQGGPVGVLGPDGTALALVVDRDGAARPTLVLQPN